MDKTELLETLQEVTDANLEEIEQTRQQIREIMAVRLAVISREELEEEDNYLEKTKQLLARLFDRLQEGEKTQQAMSDDHLAKEKI
jgi:BMFP domain-containing protein YqiC